MLPATAVCPGCSTMVVLPVEPRGPEDEPLICGTCGVEVPDHRLEIAATRAAEAAQAGPGSDAAELPENRIYTRGSLLKGLRDAAADRALNTVRELGERAKF